MTTRSNIVIPGEPLPERAAPLPNFREWGREFLRSFTTANSWETEIRLARLRASILDPEEEPVASSKTQTIWNKAQAFAKKQADESSTLKDSIANVLGDYEYDLASAYDSGYRAGIAAARAKAKRKG